MTNGNSLPHFTEENYVVRIRENSSPPQFLVDVDTTEELLGVPVKYSLFSDQLQEGVCL